MARTPPEERLLQLTAWLLAREEPASFEEIREAFPHAYEGSPEAVDKRWTRDKQSLHEAGVPIEFVEGDAERAEGYFIDPRAYALPELHLAPEEAAVLWTAGRAAMRMSALPWRAELESALRKLQCESHTPPATRPALPALFFGPPAASDQATWLERLGDAVRRRKRIRLGYVGGSGRRTDREVDVYGFAWRRGVWLFAGHCHLRQALRVFYVGRVASLTLNPAHASQPDYDVPADFDIRTFSSQQPWEYWFEKPTEVQVQLTGALAPLAASLLPGSQVSDTTGGVLATVQARDLPTLVRHVLTLGEDAEVVSPPRARALAREALEQVLRAHGATP